MAPGCSTASNAEEKPKRRRKVLTLHEKMTILKKIEQGRKYSSLAREYNINESSIRTIKKCENKIKTSINMLANSATVKSTFLSRRDTIIEQMEHLLNVWIDDQTIKNVPLTSNMIRNEAKCIYDRLKSQKPQNSTFESSFCASKGWFDRFRKRANLQNICVVSEGVSLDGDGGENYKRITCWAKMPRDDDTESQQTEIEKIINLSNMIEREAFSDTEQTEIFDPVFPVPGELINEEIEDTLENDKEVFQEQEMKEHEKNEETTSSNMSDIIKAGEFLKEKILKEDPDMERSSKARKEIDRIMMLYSDIKEIETDMTDSITLSVSGDDVFSS